MNKPRRRGGGPKALAATLARITKPIFGKRGFAKGSILNDWSNIVGAQLAAHSSPQKIIFNRGERDNGTLHLCIDSGSFATELQHLEPLLVERINGFFGYRAVSRVKIIQGPIEAVKTDPAPPSPPPVLGKAAEKELHEYIDDITDPELYAALENLGRMIIGGRKK